MSYAVKASELPRHGSGSSATDRPSTAAVRSFICLYTHDLKRKQKRWQDGKLKYHTFNRRIMVYDERGGFVGDAHWQGEQDLEDGEELQLDRGSAIVQVCDYTGEQQQDLTEILDKRAQEVEKRRASAAARMGGSMSQSTVRTPAPSSRIASMPSASTTPLARRQEGLRPQPHFQLLHRPLSAIVPSPGPIGRAAVPEHSPYDARRAEQGQRQGAGTEAPARKRRRLSTSPPSSKSAFATRLFGAKLTLNGSAGASAARQRVLRDATKGQHQVELNKTSPRDVETSRAPYEDDADVVMLEGPPSYAIPQQLPATKLPKQPHLKQKTKPPGSRSREPLYPTQSSHAPSVGCMKELENNQYTTEELRQRPLQEKLQGGSQRAPHGPVQADREIGHSKVLPKPTRPSKPVRGTGDTLEDVTSCRREATEEVDRAAEDLAKSPEMEPYRAASCLGRETAQKERNDDDNIIQPSKELRTELRIKPRRRRGLLMVSEKADKSSLIATERTADVERQHTVQASPPQTSKDARRPSIQRSLHVLDNSQTEEVPRSPPSQIAHSREEPSEHATSDVCRDLDDVPVLETNSEKSSDEETASLIACNSTNITSAALETKGWPVKETMELSLLEDEDEDDVRPYFRRSRETKRSARTRSSKESNDLEASADSVDEIDAMEGSENDSSNPNPAKGSMSQRNGQEMGSEQPGPRRGTKKKSFPPFIDDDSSEEEVPRASRTRQHGKKTDLAANEDSSGEASQTPKRPTRRATARHQTRDKDFPWSDDDHDDVDDTVRLAAPVETRARNRDEDMKEKGPRIARMARKSVKSKEIFGFVLPNSNLVPTAMAAAFGRVGPVIHPELSAAPELPPEQIKPREEQDVPSNSTPVGIGAVAAVPAARIANPATRGKKAARKEDAAGLVPQVLVPLDPVAATATLRRPAAAEKPKANTSILPGFSKASGGTWSIRRNRRQRAPLAPASFNVFRSLANTLQLRVRNPPNRHFSVGSLFTEGALILGGRRTAKPRMELLERGVQKCMHQTSTPCIQILSDLHLEVGQQYSAPAFPASPPLLLLAGDVGCLADKDEYLKFLQRRRPALARFS
ncbi:hypothetical protein HJFPF1_05270 [Paramyrothecium foliicola]|nr:hypothetical protein HJFPF1_05270 [Paramyrothecium foliicola]